MVSRTILLLALLATALTGPAWSGVIHVPADQPTIQDAIVLAQSGDIVLVAPGLYAENIDFLGKAITVQGSDGPLATVIDGSDLTLGPNSGSVVTFANDEQNDSILDGFTLTGGAGSSPGDLYHGGGIGKFISTTLPF